jgi:hypothetical protein
VVQTITFTIVKGAASPGTGLDIFLIFFFFGHRVIELVIPDNCRSLEQCIASMAGSFLIWSSLCAFILKINVYLHCICMMYDFKCMISEQALIQILIN